jgi:type IV secretion system protein VirB3
MAHDEPGFEVPVHRSLTEPILLAGLPRKLTLPFWTIAAGVGLGCQQPWLLPVAGVLHAVGAALTKRDPHFFDVFRRAIRAQRRLEP